MTPTTDEEKQLEALSREIEILRRMVESKDVEIAALSQEMLLNRQHVQAILQSSSWKITKPLRKLALRSLTLRATGRKLIEVLSLRLAEQPVALGEIRSEEPPSHNFDKAMRCLSASVGKHPDLVAPVTIIVPIYNGLHHLERLLPSLFRNTSKHHPILLVDDCSPDENVRSFIERQAAGRSNVTVLHNDKNLGFVGTVNRAAVAAKGDFVLLNSDTEVPPRWLERLMSPMVADRLIATTTPFSNAATIFSFPSFCADNKLLGGLTVDEIDAAFQYIAAPAGMRLDAPTGVGFCMGVNGDAWRELGGFDQEAFGRGYGEENDWCQRAIAAGYRNVIAPSLFVFHNHGGSFASADKAALQAENGRRLSQRWPSYDRDVAGFVGVDPWSSLREAAFLTLCLAAERRPLVFIDHAIGGGANHYREARASEALLNEGRSVIVMTFAPDDQRINLKATFAGETMTFAVEGWQTILRHKTLFGACEFVYNNLVGWPDPLGALKALYELASAPAAKLTMLFHDYLAICPSFTLFDSSNRYCGIPGDVKECRACLSRNPHAIRKDIDIVEWRWHWGRLVDVANEVRFFSHDSAKLASKVWKISNSKKRVVAHSPLIDYKGRKVSVRRDGEVIIGVVGAIGFIKGAEVVQQMSHLLKKRDPRAKIVVIGMIDPHYRDESMTNVTVHGHYERAHLPQLLEQYGVSVAVVPSIVPETFSYVTQELMMLDMPVACFGLGAPAERVGAYPKGRVVTEISAEAMIDAIYEMSGRKAITRAA